jgi:ABC-type transport system involved in multi-copper enzyme maturation permease subunit
VRTEARPDPADPEEALDRLVEASTGERVRLEDVRDAADGVRAALEEALRGRELAPESLILERARRARAALDDVEEAAARGEAAAAAEAAAQARDRVTQVVDQARDLPEDTGSPSRRLPGPLRNAGTVARKEAIVALQGTRGLVLLGLFLATFGVGLESALGGPVAGVEPSVELVWTYAHSLDFVSAPLAGILLGHGLVNAERRSNTIHVLASKPVTRTGVAAGKWAGAATALLGAVAAASVIVAGVAYAFTGNLGDPRTVILYVASVYLLALAFASLALAVSGLVDRAAGSLGVSLGLYVLLSLFWQNAFRVQSLGDVGSSRPAAQQVLLYLASPFTAWWNWTSELLGPKSDVLRLPVGEPWHASIVEAVERGTIAGLPFYAEQWWYAVVMVAWCLVGLAAAVVALRVRDLA